MSLVPKNWRSLLSCRNCKQNLTAYVGDELLKLGPNCLVSPQMLIVNIATTSYSTDKDGNKSPVPNLRTNASEGDLRVWLHCIQSRGTRKLIVSPDTDNYHIGIPIVRNNNNMDVYVQKKDPVR